MANVKLPSDAELAKLFVLGRTQQEIADQFGTSLQAVNLRYHKLGLHKKPYARQTVEIIDSVWANRKGREHHNTTAEQTFRAYVRKRLGDEQLSARQEGLAASFEKRVTTGGMVLEYDVDSKEGWRFVPREESDGDWVIRFPADWDYTRAKIDIKLLNVLQLRK